MERLKVQEGFDVHEYRHGLKLLKEDRETMRLANRDGFACPACGREFEKLLVSEKRTHTFNSPPGPFCLVRTDEQLLLLTH
ncbi:DUF7385 family protein [Halorhabdus amylolytica]|uniref:DUF7385 family protein n=1 Tax=Halorhabdus amylolytica TaxID=2559573 RepID=UPI0010AA82CC|nr:flagella cluster protein [Halorhabdus amylolytica]